MKKIYKTIMLASFGILFLNTSQAQVNTYQNELDVTEDQEAVETINPAVRFYDSNQAMQRRTLRDAPIYSEDFGNGMPTGWTLFGDGSAQVPWVWSLTTSWGFYAGNQALGPGTSTITSPTAANGFLKNDPDSALWAIHGAIPFPQDFFDTYIVSAPIDLSDADNPIISWYQHYRFNNNRQLMFGVSTDNGVTWTEFIVNEPGVVNNVHSSTEHFVEINIASVAANQSSVLLRWGWTARVYFWLIDDIEISEALENELILTNAHYNSTIEYVGPLSTLTFDFFNNLEYGTFHNEQLRDIEFLAVALNNGMNNQTQTQLVVSIDGPGDFSETLLSETLSIPSGTSDTLSVGWTLPNTIGEYNVTFTIISENIDDNPANNFTTRTFKISSEYNARDLDIDTGTYTATTTDASPSGDYRIGALYANENASTLYGIACFIAATSDAGNFFNTDVFLRTPGSNTRAFVESTPEVMLTTEGLGNWVISYFEDPLDLEEETILEYYFVYFESTNPGQKIFVRTAQPAVSQTARVVRPPNNTSGVVISATPKIRPIHVENPVTVGINQNEFAKGIIYKTFPNPTSEALTMEFELFNLEQVNLKVYDIQGKLVKSENWGGMPAGNHNRIINTSTLGSGVYLFNLNIGNVIHSKKIIVK
ncbi:MAG: T9SS type A sorting domain-containing protein [Luteibaculaceae bacterium]